MDHNNKKSKEGFCIIPWIHMHLSANGDVFSCIEATSEGNPFGNIEQKSFEEIFNSEKIKELRLDMLSGALPLQCKKCHFQESLGKVSRRLQNNQEFDKHLSLLNEMGPDGTVPEMKLRYFDFRFSNVCNLRCKMCMPQNSSSLYEDFERIYGPQSLPRNIRLAEDHPEVFKMALEQLSNVESIYFAGGEPLLMEEHYLILEELIRNGRNEDVVLAYNSNFTKTSLGKKNVLELWKKFPKITLFASIDAQGEQLDYLRKGAVWEEILQNRQTLQAMAPHVRVVATPVLSAMNALQIVDLFKALVSARFIRPEDFLLYFLYEPTFFSVNILPKEIKEKAIFDYQLLLKQLRILPSYSSTVNSFSSAVNLLREESDMNLLGEFKKYIRLFDEAQGTSFPKTFPELLSIY